MLDWSSSNFLAVALGTAVYIFDVARGDIQQLCDVEVEEGEGPQYVSSLRWDQTGQHIAVATNRAEIKVKLVGSHVSLISAIWSPLGIVMALSVGWAWCVALSVVSID